MIKITSAKETSKVIINIMRDREVSIEGIGLMGRSRCIMGILRTGKDVTSSSISCLKGEELPRKNKQYCYDRGWSW